MVASFRRDHDMNRVFALPDYYRLVPEQVLAPRIEKAAGLCRRNGLAGCLMTFRTDIYYLSGTMQQGAVFVSGRGELKLFIRRHQGRARAESPFPVIPINGFGDVAQELRRDLPAGARLGITLDTMRAAEFLGWRKRLAGVELVDLTPWWQEVKGIKDAWEIAALTRSGELAARVYSDMYSMIEPGITETKAAGRVVGRLIANGSTGLLRSRHAGIDPFNTQLSSGPEGAWPSSVDACFNGLGLGPAFPFGAGLKPIRENEPVVVDIGVCLEGYMVDLTRTYCLGKVPDKLLLANRCLEGVEAALCRELRPGAVSGELFDLAVNIADRLGFGDSFLGLADQRIKFVGHGVGLELGAPPYLLKGSGEKVKAGQVYALELKIVLDIGPVGLENTVLVEEDGPARVITPAPLGL